MKVSLRASIVLICAAFAVVFSPGIVRAAQDPLLAEPYQDMARSVDRSDEAGVDDYAGRVQNPYSFGMDTTADAAEAPSPPAKPVPAARPYAAPRASAPPPVAQPGCVAACESCNADCCGSMSDACCCRPTWTVTFDGLAMNRSRADWAPLARRVIGGDVLLSTSDLDFRWEPGFRMAFQRRLGSSDWDLEVVFADMGDFNSRASVTDVREFAFTAPHFVALAGRDVGMDFTYNSKLYSTEINLKRCVGPAVTLIGGFRWIEMSEDFSGSFFDDRGSLPFWITDVNNHLYGGQVGADVAVWNRGGPLSIRAIGKAGIYLNHVDQGTASPPAQTAVSASDDHTALVGELDFVAVYQVNRHLALRAGYELLWLDGVALAPEQIGVTDLAFGVAAVDVRSDAFYHGAIAGVEVTW